MAWFKMGWFNWSKETRISIMLALNIIFFFVELISGFMVHSLALTADAFHMLNDIISLVVGLWAVNVSRKATSNKFSYGFVRAEILGAFFNAIFLMALCISIILEAVTRFVEPPKIESPQLILYVGCAGLASNLIGFFVLGGHSHGHGDHSHGGHDHDHDHDHAHGHSHAADNVHAAEEGRAYGENQFSSLINDGPAAALLPEATVDMVKADRHIQFDSSEGGQRSEPVDQAPGRSSMSRGRNRRRSSTSKKHNGLTSIDDMSIHPASFRRDIINHSQSRVADEETDESSQDDDSAANSLHATDPSVDENSPLIDHDESTRSESKTGHSSARCSHSLRRRRGSSVHKEHNHNKPKPKSAKKSHGHNHDDMGMNGLILHVIGDALGNLGVIVTALIIWLTDLPGKYYADPAVSLLITLIILRSAIPLTRVTAQVLLQATPDHIDSEEIKEDIKTLPGVISCHHVHIWQLSDTKVIASMHIQVSFPVSDEGGERYMKLAKQARSCLHAYGIHSATIQPEFCVDEDCSHVAPGDGADDNQPFPPKCGPTVEGGAACLLGCVDDCDDQGCCTVASATASKAGSSRRSSHSTLHTSHDEHDHDH